MNNLLMENNVNDIIIYKYNLNKENIIYKIIIGKSKNTIFIQCNDYKIQLNKNEISTLTKGLICDSIDDAYNYIINKFEQKKVEINEILINKKLIWLLKQSHNKKEGSKITLIYKYEYSEDKNIIYDQTISNEEDKISNLTIKNENPTKIECINIIGKDTIDFLNFKLDNIFIVFKSIFDIYYIIYGNKYNSIICYDIVDNKQITEIKNAHNHTVNNFRHFLDEINERDLIISVSSEDKTLKLWNVNNFELLTSIENIYEEGILGSCCFLNDNKNQIYIITSSIYYKYYCGEITFFDLDGNKKKELRSETTYFIDIYYNQKYSSESHLKDIYILTGNNGFSCSYDYNKDISLYHKYCDGQENNNNYNGDEHLSLAIRNKNEVVELIESSTDGNIRIWNFHSAELLKKINAKCDRLYSVCLWNNDYVLVGGRYGEIIIFGKEINKNNCPYKKKVLTIKTIIHPKYGKCIISYAYEEYNAIKLCLLKD